MITIKDFILDRNQKHKNIDITLSKIAVHKNFTIKLLVKRSIKI